MCSHHRCLQDPQCSVPVRMIIPVSVLCPTIGLFIPVSIYACLPDYSNQHACRSTWQSPSLPGQISFCLAVWAFSSFSARTQLDASLEKQASKSFASLSCGSSQFLASSPLASPSACLWEVALGEAMTVWAASSGHGSAETQFWTPDRPACAFWIASLPSTDGLFGMSLHSKTKQKTQF